MLCGVGVLGWSLAASAESAAPQVFAAAASAEIDDDEPPPNHGKKRREPRARRRPDQGRPAKAHRALAPSPSPPSPSLSPSASPPSPSLGPSPPSPTLSPSATLAETGPDAADDRLAVHRAGPARLLPLGQSFEPAARKGGHKKRPSVYFAEASAVLDRRAHVELTRVAAMLEHAPAGAKLRLSGHADNLAEPATRLRQSRNRARAVQTWLVAHGVPASRIVLEWYGDTAPIGKNQTVAGRSVNRRVDYAFAEFAE